MSNTRTIIDYALFVFFILFFIAIFAWASHKVIEEWEIEKSLDDHGVSTTGIVISCNSGQKSTPLGFEYEVTDSVGETVKYTTTNHGGGGTSANCRKGQTVTLRYLPESPDVARHSRNTNFSTNILIAVCSLAIAISILYKGLREGITSSS